MTLSNDEKFYGDIDEANNLISDLLQPTEPVSIDSTEDENKIANELQQKRELQRRDRIVYLALMGVKLNDANTLKSIANDFDTGVDVVKNDIVSLTCKKTWKLHKDRLKTIVGKKKQLKELLVENRKREITETVLSFREINENMLVDFAVRYECEPRVLINDISQLKKPNYWYSNYMHKKTTKQKALAAVKFVRIHLNY